VGEKQQNGKNWKHDEQCPQILNSNTDFVPEPNQSSNGRRRP
jgi:hypothetical protein